MTLIN